MKRLLGVAWALTVAAASVLAAHADGPAPSSPPRGYLTWRAPHGHPDALSSLVAPCDSSARRDTLFLSFATGRKAPLYAVGATLYFRAPVGDTLGASWWYGGGPSNPWNVKVEFPGPTAADSAGVWRGVTGCVSPWRGPGPQPPTYDRTAGSGRLKVGYSVKPEIVAVAADSVLYCFARVIVPRPRTSVARCEQPVCVELGSMDLFFDDSATPADLPMRHATWNSPDGAVCGAAAASIKTLKSAPTRK